MAIFWLFCDTLLCARNETQKHIMFSAYEKSQEQLCYFCLMNIYETKSLKFLLNIVNKNEVHPFLFSQMIKWLKQV